MAGIYIHIPFCKSICHYCDFHRSASLRHLPSFLGALGKEIDLRSKYLKNKTIETIYIGGGTPSVLSADQLNTIFNKLFTRFSPLAEAEITLEANPDDLPLPYLKSLKNTPVNRLSIGIQSFDDAVLRFLNRRHSARQALVAVENSVATGFENLSIDLIYGIPGFEFSLWKKTLETAFSLPIKHLSAYHLTLEVNTRFSLMKKRGELKEIGENESIKQMLFLQQKVSEAGFLQYEISNFCLPGFFSKHNTSYWFQKPYLGLGPSAHSFDLGSRSWNVANNLNYIKTIEKGEIPCQTEHLSETDRYNDYVLTRLRTMWGISEQFVEQNFSPRVVSFFKKNLWQLAESKFLEKENQNWVIPPEHRLISDYLIEKLFF